MAQSQKKTKSALNLFSQNNLRNASQMAAPVNTLYTFSTFTAVYQPITGISLTSGLKWDDPNLPVSPGFNFKLYNDQGTTINFAEGNYITFDNPNVSILTLASPMFEDICDRAFKPSSNSEGDPGGVSDISYTVTGTAGSRICKIQVQNAGFFEEQLANDTSVSSVNFQVWLYETSWDIEFRFGAVDIQNPSINLQNPNGFICGLGEKVDLNTANNQSSNLLSGPHTNPTMVALTTNVNEVIAGAIESGRVYKFSRVVVNPVGITTASTTKPLSLYPNPASSELFISNISHDTENAFIEFYDVTGKKIHSEKLKNRINLSTFNKGVYVVKIKIPTGESLLVNRIVITD